MIFSFASNQGGNLAIPKNQKITKLAKNVARLLNN
jgi:hypothetical protein